MTQKIENRKALIVIDMQIMPFIWKDYHGKAIYREKELLEQIKMLIQNARAADMPVFYILYTEKGESHRAEGKPLWQVHPDIVPGKKDVLVVKYFADSFFKTDLEPRLRESEINKLVLCGVQTEYCVDTTCRSALSRGFEIELVEDGHSTYDSEFLRADQIIQHHNQILKQFADVIPANQIQF
ncbi:cysteine hydrolase family protein [Flexilinea flocculi]|jgi:nicotinamidase-related amidase|uniref:Nicotinamidase-related amidase n=1 Tax=Flexilinea flocculi TaxID=1678840 RepID=A0A0K8PB81_9CHLR|nr:cysteine hydrolase family protein [Flexilinea flocculi]GAP39769.1 nicotinamidase-related amidase [Flexilinea flocculi]